MEPERKIEKLLRAFAKKRRDDAGAPFDVHPATRRLLQGEVARQFRKPQPGNFFQKFFLLLQPKLIYAACSLAIILVGAFIALPYLKKSEVKTLTKLNGPATVSSGERDDSAAVRKEPASRAFGISNAESVGGFGGGGGGGGGAGGSISSLKAEKPLEEFKSEDQKRLSVAQAPIVVTATSRELEVSKDSSGLPAATRPLVAPPVSAQQNGAAAFSGASLATDGARLAFDDSDQMKEKKSDGLSLNLPVAEDEARRNRQINNLGKTGDYFQGGTTNQILASARVEPPGGRVATFATTTLDVPARNFSSTLDSVTNVVAANRSRDKSLMETASSPAPAMSPAAPVQTWLGAKLENFHPANDRVVAGKQQVGGILVTEVGTNSPAAAMGLKPLDIILSWQSQPLESHDELLRRYSETSIGTKISLGILRAEKPINLNFTRAGN